ncbi:MAG: serine/threonine-protein kinase, partial [Myxococcota bacterium]|nr:serine/threonine-protein kinase [Myxococcota bacterium]
MKACPLCGRVTDASDGKCEADGADLAPFEPAVPEGEIVAGTYRILRPIGAGPSGETYEASEEPGGDRAIVKLLSDDVSKDKRLADQIRRQVVRQKEFAHRFVARVRAVDVRGERLVVVRDMVAGRRLGDILAAEGGLAVERALALAGRICEALGEAHRLGILHLQIRPSNVFVVPGEADAPEEPRLVDFGIGPRVKVGGKPFFGVPAYLAPEQIEGKIVSFRSDIFSLGVLLYQTIEGRPPFVGDDVAVVDALVNAPEPPIRADSPDPQILAVRTLLGQLLQKKPIHRPIGMSHVCDRIREIQAISSGKAGAPAEAARHVPPPPPGKAAIARIAL